jgi:hypothetical protein
VRVPNGWTVKSCKRRSFKVVTRTTGPISSGMPIVAAASKRTKDKVNNDLKLSQQGSKCDSEGADPPRFSDSAPNPPAMFLVAIW